MITTRRLQAGSIPLRGADIEDAARLGNGLGVAVWTMLSLPPVLLAQQSPAAVSVSRRWTWLADLLKRAQSAPALRR